LGAARFVHLRRWGEYQHRRPAASLPLLLPLTVAQTAYTPPAVASHDPDRPPPPPSSPPPERPASRDGRGDSALVLVLPVSACGYADLNRPMTMGREVPKERSKRKLDGPLGRRIAKRRRRRRRDQKPAATRLVVVARYPRPPSQ